MTRPLLASLLEGAHTRPEAPALVAGDTRLTHGAFARRIAGAAGALAAAGVPPGSRVLLSAPNGIDMAVAYFAIHGAGATAVLLAPDTPDAERDDVIARTRPALVLGPAATPLETLEAEADPSTLAIPAPDTAGDILFTTGTTGRRKGVVLAHAALAAIGRNIAMVYGLGPALLQTVPLPMCHSHGLGTLRALAVAGSALHIERGMVNPRAMIERMKAEGANGLALVPAAAEMLKRYAPKALASLAGQLRLIELGSAPLAPETRAWLAETLPGTRILHHYGMTEASRAFFADYGRDPPGTAGLPAPGVTPTILGPDGRPAAPGDAGEIHVAGDILMQGYLADDELDTGRLGPFGFATGDHGVLDTDGRLTLLGRGDDILNVGGKKLVPDEVEAALVAADPAVTAAACTGLPDPVLGEAVQAHLVLAPGTDADALLARLPSLIEARLEAWKRPVRYTIVAELPMTASGKLQRARLKTG